MITAPQHMLTLTLVSIVALSCFQAHTFSLKDTRDLCKRHRFKILAVTAAAVAYMYTHKLIKKAIQDYYKNKTGENSQIEQPKNQPDYFEAFADAFIKTTKLVATLFKVFRASTVPDEGKTAGYQWLDDFSQMA